MQRKKCQKNVCLMDELVIIITKANSDFVWPLVFGVLVIFNTTVPSIHSLVVKVH